VGKAAISRLTWRPGTDVSTVGEDHDADEAGEGPPCFKGKAVTSPATA
jgi:hypothetical protein